VVQGRRMTFFFFSLGGVVVYKVQVTSIANGLRVFFGVLKISSKSFSND
jgi:hypothetical protein